MKKFLILTGIVAILFVAAVIVLINVDFNRLGKENTYVQMTTPASVEETKLGSGEILKRYWYTLPSYDENGDVVEVEFSAAKELRKDAYLMLYLKNGNEVTSYDEVELDDVPEKAREMLEESY